MTNRIGVVGEEQETAVALGIDLVLLTGLDGGVLEKALIQPGRQVRLVTAGEAFLPLSQVGVLEEILFDPLAG
jgi:hypothetical protein